MKSKWYRVNRKNLHIGLSSTIRYEVKTVACKRVLCHSTDAEDMVVAGDSDMSLDEEYTTSTKKKVKRHSYDSDEESSRKSKKKSSRSSRRSDSE